MARWTHTLARTLRHRWLDERDARRALPAAALGRIEARVAASERRHSGEIRVCVEAGLPWSYLRKGLKARDRAITLFGKLRVWDTEHNNGVLVYLLLADHAIEVVADRGLSAQVPAERWQTIVAQMREPLRAGRVEEAVSAAVDQVDALLTQHFPLADGEASPNELPNRPLIC